MFGKRSGTLVPGRGVARRIGERCARAAQARSGRAASNRTQIRDLFPDQVADLWRLDRSDRSLRAVEARPRERARRDSGHRP